MAGMRSVVRAGWSARAGVALLAPAGAQAGTYDVVSCSAPGANGRNNSLEYVTASYDPQYNAPARAPGTRPTASCADGLIARSQHRRRTVARRSGSPTAYWTFIAPAGTEIVGVTSWRFAEARDQGGDDPNTPAGRGRSLARRGRRPHEPADRRPRRRRRRAAHGVGVPCCNVGAPGGTRADAPRR